MAQSTVHATGAAQQGGSEEGPHLGGPPAPRLPSLAGRPPPPQDERGKRRQPLRGCFFYPSRITTLRAVRSTRPSAPKVTVNSISVAGGAI